MKPSRQARIAAAITLSKGKMYEYGVPLEDHLKLPDGLDLEQQFPLAIGTLGDFASEAVLGALGLNLPQQTTRHEDLVFSAQVLQAFDDSRLNQSLTFNLRLLAASAYYLGDIPGSAAVLIQRLRALEPIDGDELAMAVRWALDRPWSAVDIQVKDERLNYLLAALRQHFRDGSGQEAIKLGIARLRSWVYESGSAHELLLADILCAICINRIANSAWTLLSLYSDLPSMGWNSYLRQAHSIREMWPSQRMLGDSGLYRGLSGVVQMPTSAGKTRATEIILRSAFLSGRTTLAVVVAPFRALCQEIANDLQSTFAEDGYRVNQLSDALQSDYPNQFLELLGVEAEQTPNVVVLTPEKLLFVLRQEPGLVEKIGVIIYDEGHQFDTGTRGVTYELLLTSIKRLLKPTAQTILISAVIQNAPAVAKWLLADDMKVVSDRQLQTRRLVAFVSLPEGKSGQLQFNAAGEGEQRFFVPKVIVNEQLKLLSGERVPRIFPTKDSASIALYLALRLIPNGGVAIYARTRASAAKVVRDAVQEVFGRSVSHPAPATHSVGDEIDRLKHLFQENFGSESYLTRGAELGIFAHHGNTPYGLRLAIEHAMREKLIRLIVCTSTLAQGVNLPIRYLLVTSPMQGRESIKARDFHNLMGRAGRAGMYGEGTIVFTDHRLFDERAIASRRWDDTKKLLQPASAGPTGSTLLDLLKPMHSDNGYRVIENPSPFEIATQLVDDREALYRKIKNLPAPTKRRGFSTESLLQQLDIKRATIESIESFLMTYRGEGDSPKFIESSRALARETLAFSIATTEQQVLLEDIFEKVALRIESVVPDVSQQARYGRSLLGVDKSQVIDAWVTENLFSLYFSSDSPEELFETLWPLLTKLSSEKRLRDTEPADALFNLANGWLAGNPFKELLSVLDAAGAAFPYGKRKQGFNIDNVVQLCEQTFGFEFGLFIAAIKEAFSQAAGIEDEKAKFTRQANILQKRLKYGLPSYAVPYFEAGFAERVVAQQLASEIFFGASEDAKSVAEARANIRFFSGALEPVISRFPSYFTSIFSDMTL